MGWTKRPVQSLPYGRGSDCLPDAFVFFDFTVADVDHAVGVQGDIVLVVTRMIVLPCWCSRSNSAMISLPVAVSRFPVGSSASRIEDC